MRILHIGLVGAAIFGLMGVAIGLAIAYVFGGPPRSLAMMIGGFTYVAALILFFGGHWRYEAVRRRVRRMLLRREDINDADFVAAFPDIDSTLLLQARQAVGEFFDVPSTKLHPTDTLRDDLQFKKLGFPAYCFVLGRALAFHGVPSDDCGVCVDIIGDIGDLADVTIRLLEEYKEASADRELDNNHDVS